MEFNTLSPRQWGICEVRLHIKMDSEQQSRKQPGTKNTGVRIAVQKWVYIGEGEMLIHHAVVYRVTVVYAGIENGGLWTDTQQK